MPGDADRREVGGIDAEPRQPVDHRLRPLLGEGAVDLFYAGAADMADNLETRAATARQQRRERVERRRRGVGERRVRTVEQQRRYGQRVVNGLPQLAPTSR